MYIPKHYEAIDRNEIIQFMRQYSFAVLITSENNHPVATHLPFHIEENENELILTSHLSKANPHWKQMEKNPALVIFSGPDAYISPDNYESKMNVPTWNYVAVHTYGKVEIITYTAGSYSILNKMIGTYEEKYRQQWNNLPEEYKTKMIKGIVPFRIKVDKLQAKKKLSQNKTETERNNIITTLSASPHQHERDMAEMMSESLLRKSKKDDEK